MSGREFLDTNVLIYAHDARDERKRARARELSDGRMPSPEDRRRDLTENEITDHH